MFFLFWINLRTTKARRFQQVPAFFFVVVVVVDVVVVVVVVAKGLSNARFQQVSAGSSCLSLQKGSAFQGFSF